MSEFLKVNDLARELNVSPRWIHDQIRHGGLPHHYIGESRRILRFRLGEVLQWIESGSAGSIDGGHCERNDE